MKVRKALKASVTRCCDCERIVTVKDSMIRPYSVEMSNKKSIKVICFDCQIRELVSYG